MTAFSYAWNQGYDACKYGSNDCPYLPGTDAYSAWWSGWQAALDEGDDE